MNTFSQLQTQILVALTTTHEMEYSGAVGLMLLFSKTIKKMHSEHKKADQVAAHIYSFHSSKEQKPIPEIAKPVEDIIKRVQWKSSFYETAVHIINPDSMSESETYCGVTIPEKHTIIVKNKTEIAACRNCEKSYQLKIKKTNWADTIVANMVNIFNREGSLTAEWEKQAYELERIAHYGTGTPTYVGLFNLLSMIRSLDACLPRTEFGERLRRATPIFGIGTGIERQDALDELPEALKAAEDASDIKASIKAEQEGGKIPAAEVWRELGIDATEVEDEPKPTSERYH